MEERVYDLLINIEKQLTLLQNEVDRVFMLLEEKNE